MQDITGLVEATINSLEKKKTITGAIRKQAKQFLWIIEKDVDLTIPANRASYIKYRQYLKTIHILD